MKNTLGGGGTHFLQSSAFKSLILIWIESGYLLHFARFCTSFMRQFTRDNPIFSGSAEPLFQLCADASKFYAKIWWASHVQAMYFRTVISCLRVPELHTLRC
jgi:hypothetical protein